MQTRRWSRRAVTVAAFSVILLCAVIVLPVAMKDSPKLPQWVDPSSRPSLAPQPGLPTPSPTAAHNKSRHEIGVSDNLGHLPLNELRTRLRTMKQAGIKWLRKDIEWRGAERTHGSYDWSVNDHTVAEAKRFGIKTLLILGYAPEWAAAPGQGNCMVVRCSPADTPQIVAAFAEFARQVALHYCNKAYGAAAFEIWNEPNLHKYWPNPNAKLYLKFLRAAHKAIRDTGCAGTILLGSLGDSGCHNCMSSTDFLTDIYKYGGKGMFDAVGSHPYTTGVPKAKEWRPYLLHAIMARHGDGHKQVWATEFAYASSHVGTKRQATYMQGAVNVFRTYPWAGPLFWFSLKDNPNGETFGLIAEDGTPKPALNALGQLAQAS